MAPLTLLIIRHAEKPKEDGDKPKEFGPGPGFTDEGEEDDKSLVIRGWQRAGAWAALFNTGMGEYPKPDVVYAALPGPPGKMNHGPSRRPAETVSALAVKANTKYALDQEPELIKEVLDLSGVVLISWEHHAIVQRMVPQIPLGEGSQSPPKKWPGDRFDVVLRFERSAGANTFSFTALYPRLLPGDTANPL